MAWRGVRHLLVIAGVNISRAFRRRARADVSTSLCELIHRLLPRTSSQTFVAPRQTSSFAVGLSPGHFSLAARPHKRALNAAGDSKLIVLRSESLFFTIHVRRTRPTKNKSQRRNQERVIEYGTRLRGRGESKQTHPGAGKKQAVSNTLWQTMPSTMGTFPITLKFIRPCILELCARTEQRDGRKGPFSNTA